MDEQNTSQRAGQHSAHQNVSQMPKATSAMAITGLVLGIIALLTSFVPIINNLSFILAILAVVFSVVGLVSTVRGTRSGKGLAIAALVISIVAGGVVLATQAAYSAAINDALSSIETVVAGGYLQEMIWFV